MGGYATKNLGAVPINRGDLEATLGYFALITGVDLETCHLLGSTGKVPTSNDIDVAIDTNKYSPNKLHIALSNHGVHGHLNRGTMVASYTFPICSEQSLSAFNAFRETGELVQLDLMFTPHPDWAKFAYYADQHSQYKGAVRTILLMATAASLNVPGVDYFGYDKNKLVVRAGRVFDLNRGLRRIFQNREKRKDGKGYLSRMTTIDAEEFYRRYPDVKLAIVPTYIPQPRRALHVMFDKPLDEDHVRTAEQVLKLIGRFDKKRQDCAIEYAHEKLKPLKDKMLLPPDLS